VTIGTLVEELWGGYPPHSSVITLQTYVLQLRNRLATQHGGHMLEKSRMPD
jgi:hypothetical protein